LEADYFLTHFRFKHAHESQQKLYLEIQTNLGIKELFNCNYDEYSAAYRCDALLKQGIYNYRYRFFNSDTTNENGLEYTEGNFAETMNDYHCFLYQRDPVYQMDQIIGFYKLSNRP
jgi:hypothetical protein